MTKGKEIQIYWKALFNYKLTRLLPFLSKRLDTDKGFCAYFRNQENIEMYNLSTLYSFKNETQWDDRCPWWFPEGEKTPRIKLLKKAINILEDKAKL